MKCDYYEKYGLLQKSGELNAADSSLFLQHSASCLNCQKQLQVEEELYLILQNDRIKAPAELNSRIMLKINRQQRFSKWLSKKMLYSASVAALFALLFFANMHISATKDNLADWQPEEGLNSLSELSLIEDQLVLLDTDYRQPVTQTPVNEVSDDLDQVEESLGLIDNLGITE